MTEENRRANVHDELRLAGDALRAAEVLLANGLAADATSRSYYAALHAARALLFSIGIEGTSHQGVRNLVGQHFVKTGLLPSSSAKDLAQLEGLRSASDYDSAFCAGVDDIGPELERARSFVARCESVLRAQGVLK